tara:strand:+ start:138 stop:371 length:234 start_codon:yes stop_codon:yes gene_type:complete
MSESRRRANFVRLAQNRTTRAIQAIRVIGNLSNKGNYEYTQDDVKKIKRALEQEIRLMENRFSTSGSEDVPEFKLED